MAETLEQARRRLAECMCALHGLNEYQRPFIEQNLDAYAALAVSAREAELREQIEARRRNLWTGYSPMRCADFIQQLRAESDQLDWLLSLLPAPPQETGGPKG